MKVIVFNVEHGFCAFIKTPTNYGRMIDCGCTSTFSPALYITKNELPNCVSWGVHSLAHLTITHPHNDHIEDIDAVMDRCEPAFLRAQGYAWDEVKDEEAGYENLDAYSDWREEYNPTSNPKPDYGMQFSYFYLTPDEAKKTDELKFVNNSSIVTVATVKGTLYSEKFLFGGDMETAGWEALLKKDAGFEKAVRGTDFFIVSHHGHKSGFSEELYKAMGRRPILNIVSIHKGDEKIDSRYSKSEYALGIGPEDDPRRCLTTRHDGSITVRVGLDGRYSVSTQHLDGNRKA